MHIRRLFHPRPIAGICGIVCATFLWSGCRASSPDEVAGPTPNNGRRQDVSTQELATPNDSEVAFGLAHALFGKKSDALGKDKERRAIERMVRAFQSSKDEDDSIFHALARDPHVAADLTESLEHAHAAQPERHLAEGTDSTKVVAFSWRSSRDGTNRRN